MLKKKITAFSPAHITGLFEICDQPKYLLIKGTRGAGISMTKGTRTTVMAQRSHKKLIEVRMNGEITGSAEVTQKVVKMLLSLAKRNYRIFVEHEVEVPIGCGFGSSGAGALSLALAMNEALGLELSKFEVGQIAHTAEVECKTGLGTVIAEMSGGAEIRIKPGAPGVGQIMPIELDNKYVVACLSFGPISTKKALSDPKLRKKINKAGGKLVTDLIQRPTLHYFMKYSRCFAESSGLISEKVRRVLRDTDNHHLTCSMAMLGNTVFSVTQLDEVEKLIKIFRHHTESDRGIITAKIDFRGARLLR
jgi:pantoate kinase